MNWKYRVLRHLPVSASLKLRCEEFLVNRVYRNAISKEKDRSGREQLEFEHHSQLQELDDQFRTLTSRKLLTRARRMRAYVPPLGDDYQKPQGPGYWEEATTLGGWILSDKGVRVVRDNIREELRWRMERRAEWAPWINIAISLAAAFAGYVLGRGAK